MSDAAVLSDARLAARARQLSRRYLGGHARPVSVRWVDTMDRRWGSCTPLAGTIRISHHVASMPGHVRDYVLLHELAHLLIAGHGPGFWTLLASFPHLDRARAHLAAAGGQPARRLRADRTSSATSPSGPSGRASTGHHRTSCDSSETVGVDPSGTTAR